MSGLKQVVCRNTTPPSVRGTTSPWEDVDVSQVTLEVPAESVEAYKSELYWKDFKEIKGRNFAAEANDEFYAKLTEQINTVQSALDAVKNTFNTEYKDVQAQFATQISSIQNSIDSLSAEIKSQYDSMTLTAETTIDTTNITAAIEKVLADGKVAQEQYNIKKSENEEAYTKLTAEIAKVQTALDAAKETISTECKDVTSQFTTAIADIQKAIDGQKADLEAKFKNVELTAESTIDTSAITTSIDKLLSDAKAAQKAYEEEQEKKAANEEAYKRLTAQIATVQTTLDAAKNTINTECKDVASQFTEQIASIQERITALSTDVKTKYDKVALTAESTIDTASITTAIEKLLSDAKAAQKAYEEEQARIAANEEAYKRLTAELANILSAYDKAKTAINAECADVAAEFASRLEALQKEINEQKTNVEEQYKNIALTAESTVNSDELLAEIAQLKSDADKAQKEYEEEQARIAANEEAYKRLTAQIATVQTTLDAAKNTISTECKDVASQFTEQIASIQERITALSTDVKAKYDNVALTAESAVDTASITAAIEKLLSDAKSAQKAYEEEQAKIAANEEAYTRLTAQIASVQTVLDAAKNTISTECKDVASQFTEQITSIQERITALSADVKAKYDNVALTAESKIEIASITTAIEKLLADAKNAQELFEAGEAAKLANEVAYARLSEQIASVQSVLDAAKETINTECKDVASKYTGSLASLQEQINELKSGVEEKYNNVELTAESTMDTASIETAIEKLLSDAKAAQKAYEEEQARKDANEKAYTRLTIELTNIQSAYDQAKATINIECADVAADFASRLETLQQKINELKANVEEQYNNIALTAESTIDSYTLYAEIAQLKSDANKAQKEYEEEEARIAANEEAYTRLITELTNVQSAYNQAKAHIRKECPDVSTDFASHLDALQEKINAQKANVEEQYKDIALTAESTVNPDELLAEIAQLKADANKAQREYEEEQAKEEANDEAYTRLTAQIAAVQTALDAVKDTISTECKDVASQFTEQIDSIQSCVEALRADVNTKYRNVELTAESTIDTESIEAAIEKLLSEAKAAQKEYEDALSIGSVSGNSEVVGIYTLTGKKVSETQKGQIYIFRYVNGKAVKKLVK